MSPAIDHSPPDLRIEPEWDSMCDIVTEEPLLKISKVEVKKVLEEWTSDEEDGLERDSKDCDLDIMEVDEQLGSSFLLADDIFGFDYCSSPVSPLDELASMNLDEDKFGTPDLAHEHPSFSALPAFIDERYHSAFQKLAESMKKSQETRASLTMRTEKASDSYERRSTVSAVLDEIEKSSNKIYNCLAVAYQSVEV